MKTRIRRSEHEDISGRKEYPSGHGMDEARSAAAAKARGGVTPFNVLAMGHGYSQRSAGAYGHGAGTPVALCDWWTRYIVPPNGTVLDPFMGSGTTGIAALKRGHDYIGIERNADYIEIAQRRLLEVEASTPLFQDKGAG